MAFDRRTANCAKLYSGGFGSACAEGYVMDKRSIGIGGTCDRLKILLGFCPDLDISSNVLCRLLRRLGLGVRVWRARWIDQSPSPHSCDPCVKLYFGSLFRQ